MLFTAATFTSCSKDDGKPEKMNSSLIVGRWQLDYEEVTYEGETKVYTEDPVTATIVTFYEDGEIIVDSSSDDGREIDKGTYKLSADGKYLTIDQIGEEDEGTFSVDKLTSELMTLSITYSSNEHVVSTFKKIK